MPTIEFPGKASDFLKIGVSAAARGDVNTVREILKAKPKWLKRVGSHGRTMLWEASHRGKLEMVKYLVQRKSDIDACGTHYTPYFVEVSCYCIARHKKHDDVADFLRSKGAALNIHTAAFLGDTEGVKSFLKRSRKLLNAGHPQYVLGNKNSEGLDFVRAPAPWATPLCYALRGGDVSTVEYLINRGAGIKGNEEALMIAAGKDVEKLRLLLENGADAGKLPPVHPDEGKLFELVSSFGVKPPDSASGADLVYLCRGDRGGNPDEVRRLLTLGADVNFRDHKGKSALHRAAKAGLVDAMQILLEHGALVDAPDPKGETPLFEVVRSTIRKTENKLEAARLLIKAGATRRHPNIKGETPLSIAVKGESASSQELAKILKKR